MLNWLFDKLGYMPKISIDSTFPFPSIHKDEKPIKRKSAAKKTVVKKPVKKKA